MDESTPNPGSEKARKAGCICPIIDNGHGRGYLGNEGQFVYTVGCPVHPEGKKDDDQGTAEVPR